MLPVETGNLLTLNINAELRPRRERVYRRQSDSASANGTEVPDNLMGGLCVGVMVLPPVRRLHGIRYAVDLYCTELSGFFSVLQDRSDLFRWDWAIAPVSINYHYIYGLYVYNI